MILCDLIHRQLHFRQAQLLLSLLVLLDFRFQLKLGKLLSVPGEMTGLNLCQCMWGSQQLRPKGDQTGSDEGAGEAGEGCYSQEKI